MTVAFTPVVSFHVPGDLSISWATQQADYTVVGSTPNQLAIVRYNLVFTPTFTTASGALTISGSGLSPQVGNCPNWLGVASGTPASALITSLRPDGSIRVVNGATNLILDTGNFVSGQPVSIAGEVVCAL